MPILIYPAFAEGSKVISIEAHRGRGNKLLHWGMKSYFMQYNLKYGFSFF